MDRARILIRVYKGPLEKGQNVGAFDVAKDKIIAEYAAKHVKEFPGVEFVVDEIGCKHVRERGWTMLEFVTWFAEADIYFFISHPVQGFTDYMAFGENNWAPWDLRELSPTLEQHLGTKIGYPKHFTCGAFTQDKLVYKTACKELCTPFLVLKRTEDGRLSREDRLRVFRFCKANFELPRTTGVFGWVLKSPFTTHNAGRKFCNNVYAIPKQFKALCNKSSLSVVHTFFLEPRYGNQTEIKVVVPENDITPGIALTPFFAKNHITNNGNMRPMIGTHDHYAFAERVIRLYKERVPDAVCSPLLRIDSMETQCGILKVNEIESLEAIVDSTAKLESNGKRVSCNSNHKLSEFRETYWYGCIKGSVEAFLTSL